MFSFGAFTFATLPLEENLINEIFTSTRIVSQQLGLRLRRTSKQTFSKGSHTLINIVKCEIGFRRFSSNKEWHKFGVISSNIFFFNKSLNV